MAQLALRLVLAQVLVGGARHTTRAQAAFLRARKRWFVAQAQRALQKRLAPKAGWHA